jgi:hypothetical protein
LARGWAIRRWVRRITAGRVDFHSGLLLPGSA